MGKKEMIIGEDEILKDSNGLPILFDVDSEYEVEIVEIPAKFNDIEDFLKNTEEVDISKPYPSIHSCPIHEGSRYDKMRTGSREHGGKRYQVLYGRVKGSNKWESASLHYPKSTWSADEARSHCRSHGGIAFEAAISKADEQDDGRGLIDIKKKDDMRHLVYGILLEPYIFDLQKDAEDELEIEKAAHRFMLKMWNSERREMIGSEHSYPIASAIPVESYISPVDFWFEGTPHDDEHLVRKGSWVLVSLIDDDDEFELVKTGVYRGLSLQGKGKRRELNA